MLLLYFGAYINAAVLTYTLCHAHGVQTADIANSIACSVLNVQTLQLQLYSTLKAVGKLQHAWSMLVHPHCLSTKPVLRQLH